MQPLLDRHADGLAVHEAHKLALARLRTFTRDNAKAFVERQTRFYAANNNVDGIGELFDEFLLSLFRLHAEKPARRAKATGQTCCKCNQQ
jgi:hypothetical protein